jgi:hypothetical protein
MVYRGLFKNSMFTSHAEMVTTLRKRGENIIRDLTRGS